MKCPLCGHSEDKVIESRQNQNGLEIRRRRECLSCQNRFTSYEHIDEGQIQVIKKSGRRELFNPEKIKNGILKALGKQALTQNTLDDIVLEVQAAASALSRSREIRTTTIGELVLERLLPIDRTGYVRFASVHGQFKDFDDFRQLLDSTAEGDEKISIQGNNN